MLGWIKSLFGAKIQSSVVKTMEAIPVHKFSDYESYLKAASSKVWASWKAVDIVSQAVSTTPCQIVRKGTSNEVNVPDLQRLISYPNEYETWSDLWYRATMHLKITGNAYLYKSGANMAGDKPKNLYLLNPSKMRIAAGPSGVIGYEYRVDGRMIPFDVEEIIHIKRPHPNNEYYGLGDVEAAEPLFKDSINRDSWSESFWKNGAAPSGLLIHEEKIMDVEAFTKLKAQFQAEYGGKGNVGKTAILSGKWTYQQLGVSISEMQDIEKMRFNIENIFTLHGVPLSIAGIRDAANYATADIDRKRFKEFTILPIIILIRDTLQTDLIEGFGQQYQIVYNISGLTNVTEIVSAYTPLFDRGAMTINELRQQVGLPQDEENPLWNQTFINAGLVPLEFAGLDAQSSTGEAAKAIVSRFIEGTNARKE